MACKACAERGKTWEGDDPKCAFPDGIFATDNWNCATANRVRKLLDEVVDDGVAHERVRVDHVVMGGDTTYATIDLYDIDALDPGTDVDIPRWLWVNWYKRRGRTQAMWLLFTEAPPRLPTEAEVLAILEAVTRAAEWEASPEGIKWREKYGATKQ